MRCARLLFHHLKLFREVISPNEYESLNSQSLFCGNRASRRRGGPTTPSRPLISSFPLTQTTAAADVGRGVTGECGGFGVNFQRIILSDDSGGQPPEVQEMGENVRIPSSTQEMWKFRINPHFSSFLSCCSMWRM